MLQSFLGLLVFVAIAFLFSSEKKKVNWKLVGVGVVLQLVLGLFFFNFPYLADFLSYINQAVVMIEKATAAGTQFMFGFLAGGPAPFEITNPQNNFIIALRVLPIVLIMSALTSVLFYLGVLQKIVQGFSWLLKKSMSLTGVQGLGVSANIFLGIVEAPLFVAPYLKLVSSSTLFMIMTAGMSTVAGTVMVLYASLVGQVIENALSHILIASLISAPAAVIMAHIMVPGDKESDSEVEINIKSECHSIMESLVKGTMDGIQLLLAIIAMIIVLFALVDFMNQILSFFPGEMTLQRLVGFLFYPLVWLMGVGGDDLRAAAELMATKTVLNEFVSYQMIGSQNFGERTNMILVYAMCGFANLGSLGLLMGSFGVLIPERRAEIAKLAPRSLVSGTLATMMTGAVVGICF